MGYKFTGAGGATYSGRKLVSGGDFDGDGKNDFLVASRVDNAAGARAGKTYLLSQADMQAADAADGTIDGVIEVQNIALQANSFEISGLVAGELFGSSVSFAGDVDGDGKDDLLISAGESTTGGARAGATYLVTAASLGAADADDGTTDGSIDIGNVIGLSRSYKFIGEGSQFFAGFAVASAGDQDGDGNDDVFITSLSGAGIVYMITAADMAAMDAADGTTDGLVDLANVAGQSTSYRFSTSYSSQLGSDISLVSDFDGDGIDDFLVGAYGIDRNPFLSGNAGGAFLVSSADIAAADAADGTTDGNVDIENIMAQTSSYKIIGAAVGDTTGVSAKAIGDVDGDGKVDFLIGASEADLPDLQTGAAYLLTAADLAAADAADGTTDHIIDLGNVAAQSGSYLFKGEGFGNAAGNEVSAAGDIDGDGTDDLLIASTGANSKRGKVYVVATADLAAMDAADGTTDGIIELANVAAQTNSYEITSTTHDGVGSAIAAIGDLDGDGKADISVSTYNHPDRVTSHIVLASDLATADAADGTIDGVIDLNNTLAPLSTVVTITGTSGRDILRGKNEDSEIYGLEGDDTLYGGFPSQNTLYGGDGDDKLQAKNGVMYGDAGDDKLIVKGRTTVAEAYGGDGDDWFQVYDNLIEGDHYEGGAGFDNFNLFNVRDAVIAYVQAGTVNYLGAKAFAQDIVIKDFTVFSGSLANDQIYGGDGYQFINGSNGNDLIYGDGGDDILNGGEGADKLYGGLGEDVISGNDGKDKIYGEEGVDSISGNGGNDQIFGGDGDDSLSGNEGKDKIQGGAGNDEVYGGTGNDKLDGNDGDDKITGGDGNDKINGGAGSDILNGGVGNDKIIGGGDADIIYGGDGLDKMYGGSGDDIIYDSVTRNPKSKKADILDGGTGDDRLFGNGGKDIVFGGAGDDLLLGGEGADRLIGGTGNDKMGGGLGKDVFVFADNSGTDRIAGYEIGRDKLEIADHTGGFGTLQFRDTLTGGYEITYDGGIILLEGLMGATLTSADFDFV